ncbi:disulfide bond formation protein DsbA [Acinetobacter junii]|uniref:DsbA family oxidoreductase n=1 Tax=Acinetobacter junii TaxID=40215 RepID=UPI000C1B1B40|nr:DsbA family oxidoreductase [Acinetobacter junii]ATU44970.1 disulfide bond formation protein DsbA [Acinetobacter junii]
MIRRLNIDVFIDFICPWCLIGKRRLDMAIEKLKKSHPYVDVYIRWRGVQLIPDMPKEGVVFQQFYQRRLGSLGAVKLRQAQVRHAAQTVNFDINFDKILTMPNTAKVHHLFDFALKVGTKQQGQLLVEKIFEAYFQDGKNIGDSNVLLNIFKSCGFKEESFNRVSRIFDEPFVSANTGANGVPYFIFENFLALAGAQPVDVFYQEMLESIALQEQSA